MATQPNDRVLVPPSAAIAPPGWYPDPLAAGGWRWWDGRAWTAHAAPPPGTAAPKGRPHLPRWLSVPVVVCAPIVGLGLLVLCFVAPLAVLAGLLPLAIVLPVLAWLDRVEPEPTSSRVHAVLWGATVAILVALIVNVSTILAFGEAWAMVVSAPLIEEGMKAMGVVWAARRGEVDGVTDGIVFAGWVAVGFAAVEDVTYFADAGSTSNLLLVVLLRALLTPFSHPLYTMWTGLAIGWAVRSGKRLWPAALPGYALAVGCHFVWNGSLLLAAPDPDTGEGGSGALVLLLVIPLFIALFIAVTVVLIRMRRAEQRRFVAQWPFLIENYGLTADERALFVDWKHMLAARRRLPRADRRRFDAMRAALARLALLQGRLGDRDPVKEHVYADQLGEARRHLAEHSD
jgi:RsiW-degrading membrane proteinase PrsW (M82 family)